MVPKEVYKAPVTVIHLDSGDLKVGLGNPTTASFILLMRVMWVVSFGSVEQCHSACLPSFQAGSSGPSFYLQSICASQSCHLLLCIVKFPGQNPCIFAAVRS